MKRFQGLICGAAVLVVSAGCISHEKTVYHDVSRERVEFESERAARLFYEALSKAPTTKQGQESETAVSIPIVFQHKQRHVSGPNATFNEAVRRCDTNRDGKITELEATIFAELR